MDFPEKLVSGTFLSREKRFTVHVRLDDGCEVAAHTNNTGRMSGCLAPGARVWLSPADNPARKLKWTLELVETVHDQTQVIVGGVLVGVNTTLANRLVHEALTNEAIPHLAGYPEIKAEVPAGSRGSRMDFCLSGHDREPDCWVEVKNVTLVQEGHARFPDAPSDRGRKHLQELADLQAAGQRAALVFCIQREDALSVGPADDVDPAYGRLLRKVMSAGLEVFGAVCEVAPQGVQVARLVPVKVDLPED